MKYVEPLNVADFFLLRTPLLPLDVLESLGRGLEAPNALLDSSLGDAIARDVERVSERLARLASSPVVREGIFVASPSLYEAVEEWSQDPAVPRAHDTPVSLLRYVSRMAWRPTPFGLFAGCSFGVIGSSTGLVLGPRSGYRRHTQLDGAYLAALCEALHGDPDVRNGLIYRTSTGLYSIGQQIRYPEARWAHATGTGECQLMAIERTPYVDAVIARAETGATLRELTDSVREEDPTISREDAEAFVLSLVESQVLVSDLAPAVTGPPPLDGIISLLEGCGATRALSVLRSEREALRALDAQPLGQLPAGYQDIARGLRQLPGELHVPRLFHVDLYKRANQATLGGPALDELLRTVRLLDRIAPRASSGVLERFKEEFLGRYGDLCVGPLAERRMVPLATVLDEDIGIGFEGHAEASPILHGLEVRAHETPASDLLDRRRSSLLRGLCETLRAGKVEWALTERDISELETERPLRLPDTVAAIVTVMARSADAVAQGDFRLRFGLVSGPGGRFLGRFCHGDPDLEQAMRRYLQQEEALRPDAVFAEIAHVPDGRTGNVLFRPVLRRYEIPYLGRSGAPRERQIRLADLFVTMAEGRVVLWSRSLRREIIPRLTSAHNAGTTSLGTYRFLRALEMDATQNQLGWNWGSLCFAPFLPRVTVGRSILAPATWTLRHDELAALSHKDRAARYRAAQALRARLALPRFVAAVEYDNLLPLDLDNALCIDSWARLVSGRKLAQLQEATLNEESLVEGPEGRYAHECVVPFIRRSVVATAAPVSAKSSRRLAQSDSRPSLTRPLTGEFGPGSRWLYAKLYLGPAAVDDALADVVRPLVEAAFTSAGADRWFFIRYGDPHWHIRLRIRGDAQLLGAEVLPLLHDLSAPLRASGQIWKIELGTYEPETGRYGGEHGIDLAEQIFQADSEAVVDALGSIAPENRADARWRLALAGSHRLLLDLGLDLAARTDAMRAARDERFAEHRVGVVLERELGKRFRTHREILDRLVSPAAPSEEEVSAALSRFEERSRTLAPLVAELRCREEGGFLTSPVTSLAGSLVHMHCNRILAASHRAQELVLYDWLLRLYASEAARSKKTPMTTLPADGP